MNLIINKLVLYNLINEDEKEEYEYALKILILKSIHYLLIFLSSCILKIFWETLIFFQLYKHIRLYIGGFHAKNPFLCGLISILFVFGLFLVLKILPFTYLFMYVMTSLLLFYIFFLSLNSKFKNNLLITIILIIFILPFLYIFNISNYLLSIFFALAVSTGLYIIDKYL